MPSFFNSYPQLEGKHAMFSASQSAWLRYDDDQLVDRLITRNAAQHGTRMHAWAAETILLGLKQLDNTQTINMYVNDAIGYRMTPEQVLVASFYIFGTADCISFRKEPNHDNGILRVHDLKTGKGAVKFDQLMVYAAMFCIEYKFSPFQIDIELRIYQNDAMETLVPDPLEISQIMEHIKHVDELILKSQMEGIE